MVNKQFSLDERLKLYAVMCMYGESDYSTINMFKNKAARMAKSKAKYYKEYGIIARKVVESPVSEALKDFIPADEYIFIRTAEGQRLVAPTLRALIKIAQEKKEMKSRIISILMKPFMFTLLAFVFLGIVTFFIVPQAYNSIDVSGSPSEYLFTDVNPVIQFIYPIFLGIFYGFFIISFLMIEKLTGYKRNILDRISPIHIIYKDFASAVILSSLAANLSSGGAMKKYFETLISTSGAYQRSFFELIRRRIIDGSYSAVESLDVGFFPKEDMEMLYDFTFERSDRISEAISDVGSRAMDRTTERSARLLKICSFVFIGSFLIGTVFYGYLIFNAISEAINPVTNLY